MKPVLYTLVGVVIGLAINSSFAESRLITVTEHVGDYVTLAQDRQNTIDGCYVVVENFMTKDIAYKKELGITE